MFTYHFKDKTKLPRLGQPELININYIQAKDDPTWSFNLHSHKDSIEISYILSGKCGLYIDGNVYEAVPGDIVIKNQNTPHAEKSNPSEPVEQICINLSGIQVENMPENCLLRNDVSPVLSSGEQHSILDILFHQILVEITNQNEINLELVSALMMSALNIVAFKTQNYRNKPFSEKENSIREIRSYIDNHYKDELSLDFLSDKFHVSIFHLSRQFKKYIGYTVNNYIVSCRLGEAQKKLLFSDQSIKEIAKNCGYSNLSYFYNTFHKKIGYTPSEYRHLYKM
ncbi:AraC family transcriptional regulator [Streptococcus equinus]|uniref:AraC family transcriptional regulator n=1 Tax=Streptococcus equinus TaxID=1335 RepID=UPI003C6FFC74